MSQGPWPWFRPCKTGPMTDSSRAAAVPVERSFVVGEADTAAALGSGTLAVLATPRLLAWLEAATHSAASPVGATVIVTADPAYADGRLHRFRVSARHTEGKVVATGEITRVIVDTDRFLGRLA